ncbi:BTAD domain-containing putative transcriptional regulator [Winogradskya consettensis]|nr:BTAD domain-containing putative transcriptional regulator [Actinoplanes consettensis]
MEVEYEGQVVRLAGIKQRATLAFLLLQPNRVVATSQLVRALWPVEDPPASARKILQNAVWGLRGLLAPFADAGRPVALLTRSPGYMLRAAPEDIDIHQFHSRLQRGRAELAAGSPEKATTTLRDALDLWRGPVLTDLVEAGIVWPEAVSAQNARLVATEEYYEAELACGRHHAILGALEAAVEAEPVRERLCGQLMLALYRCGRQADALGVYSRVRSALVEDLGLEPGHGLRTLHQAILTHETALTVTAEPAPVVAIPLRPQPRPERLPGAAGPGPAPTRRERVVVMMIRTRLDPASRIEAAAGDLVLDQAAGVISEEVEAAGGIMAAALGAVSLALFEIAGDHGDTAYRAVSAALAVRQRLGGPGLTGHSTGITHSVVVGTGEAVLRRPAEGGPGPTWVSGPLLEACCSVLDSLPAGSVHVCTDTYRLTSANVIYHRSGEYTRGWLAERLREDSAEQYTTVPVVDRDRELDLVRGLLDRARHRSTPHLVTVFGEAGIGKTRFALEIGRRCAGADNVSFTFGGIPAFGADRSLAVAGEITAGCAGITTEDAPATARGKFTAMLTDLRIDDEQAAALTRHLAPLVDRGPAPQDGTDVGAVLDALRTVLERGAARQALIMVIDDLHRADDRLLEFVEDLAETAGPVPLLVVATARPALLERRPSWGGGQRHSASITLDPLSDAAIDRLLDFLELSADIDAQSPSTSGFRTLLDSLGDGPAARRRSMRRALTAPSAIPQCRSGASAA